MEWRRRRRESAGVSENPLEGGEREIFFVYMCVCIGIEYLSKLNEI